MKPEAVTDEAIPDSPKKSWRSVYKVHPAAEMWPMMSEDKLRELGEDIKKNGLKEPIMFWSMTPEDSQNAVVLDGRNRLTSMELIGMPTVELIGRKYRLTVKAEWLSFSPNPHLPATGNINPHSYARSKNLYRRHLMSKQEWGELLLQSIKLEEKADFAKLARSVERDSKGQLKGSTKDLLKEKFVEAAKDSIGKRTAQRIWDKDRGPTQTTKPARNSCLIRPSSKGPTPREQVVKLKAELEEKMEEIVELYKELSELKMGQLRFLAGGGLDVEKIRRDMVKKYHPDTNRGKMFSGDEVMADFNHFCDEIKAAISKVK